MVGLVGVVGSYVALGFILGWSPNEEQLPLSFQEAILLLNRLHFIDTFVELQIQAR